MTNIIKIALGSGLFLLICCIPEWVAPLITPRVFFELMIIGLTALLGVVGRWYWKAAEQEEGEDNALL